MTQLGIKVVGERELRRKLEDKELFLVPINQLLFRVRSAGAKEAKRRIGGGTGTAVKTISAQAQVRQGRVVIGTKMGLAQARSIEEGRRVGSLRPSSRSFVGWAGNASTLWSSSALSGPVAPRARASSRGPRRTSKSGCQGTSRSWRTKSVGSESGKTVSDLSDVRDGIKTVVEAAISGLRVYTYPEDGVLEYPCLVLEPTGDLDYYVTLDGGTLKEIITATLYLQHGTSSEGWAEVDKYRSFSAAESIKAAVETDATLNAKVDDSDVLSSSEVTRGRDDSDQFWVFSTQFKILVLKGGL